MYRSTYTFLEFSFLFFFWFAMCQPMEEKTNNLYWFDVCNWQGYKDVNNMGGGYLDWVQNEFPVKTSLVKKELWPIIWLFLYLYMFLSGFHWYYHINLYLPLSACLLVLLSKCLIIKKATMFAIVSTWSKPGEKPFRTDKILSIVLLVHAQARFRDMIILYKKNEIGIIWRQLTCFMCLSLPVWQTFFFPLKKKKKT